MITKWLMVMRKWVEKNFVVWWTRTVSGHLEPWNVECWYIGKCKWCNQYYAKYFRYVLENGVENCLCLKCGKVVSSLNVWGINPPERKLVRLLDEMYNSRLCSGCMIFVVLFFVTYAGFVYNTSKHPFRTIFLFFSFSFTAIVMYIKFNVFTCVPLILLIYYHLFSFAWIYVKLQSTTSHYTHHLALLALNVWNSKRAL